MKTLAALSLALALVACQREPAGQATSETASETNAPPAGPNPDINASLETVAEAPSHSLPSPRFVGRWAPTRQQCASEAWRFSENGLHAPSSECRFSDVREVPGGYDIAASCTVGGVPARDDVLKLRFVETIGGLEVESAALIDVGMIRCPD